GTGSTDTHLRTLPQRPEPPYRTTLPSFWTATALATSLSLPPGNGIVRMPAASRQRSSRRSTAGRAASFPRRRAAPRCATGGAAADPRAGRALEGSLLPVIGGCPRGISVAGLPAGR